VPLGSSFHASQFHSPEEGNRGNSAAPTGRMIKEWAIFCPKKKQQ
jgi:hypothetical protein